MKKIIALIFSVLCLLSYSNTYADIPDLQKLQIEAEKGEAASQFDLALAYDDGDGVEQDHAKAVYWYQKAADQGYVDAMFNLAVSYDDGEGTQQDKSKAAYWYQKAAEAGDSDAQNNLGVMHEQGDGIEADSNKAIFWYTKAAQQANSLAQYNVAYLYNIQNENLIEAYAWAVTAVKNEDPDAKELRKTIWRKLSTVERVKAKELAKQYMELYSDQIDMNNN